MGVKHKLQSKEIYFDANVFIYLLEGYAEYSSLLSQLFGMSDNGDIHVVTSELTLAETLVKPILNNDLPLQNLYQNMLQSSSNFNLVPVSRKILIAAAQLRASLSSISSGIRLPDAIHIATAQVANCKTFITNDKRLKINKDMQFLLLSELKSNSLYI